MKDNIKDIRTVRACSCGPACWQAGSWLVLLLCITTVSLFAQSEENYYNRRLVWQGNEYVYRYAVQVDRQESGTFNSHLREFTKESFIVVSLPAGNYRFRIIPHDILDRPGTATRWVRFEVRAPVVRRGAPAAPAEQVQEIIIEDSDFADEEDQATGNNEQIEDGVQRNDFSSRFNTAGVSIGTSFIDPVFVTTVHRTFSPVRNIYFQAGLDLGLFSIYDDVESFFCLYPFVNLGGFVPISNNLGFFAGAGVGYMLSNYIFEDGTVDQFIFSLNATAGVHLWNMINISYTIKTNFDTASNLLSVGFVKRFK